MNDGAPKDVLKQALVWAGRDDAGAVASLVGDHPRLIDQRGGDGVDGAPGRLDALRAHIAGGLANAQSPHEDFHPVTPLHYAVDGGSVAAARLLLASGADVRTSAGRLLTSAAS